MRTPERIRFAIPLLAVGLVGCPDSAVAPEAGSLYVLAKVDGRPTPVTFEFESGGSVTLLAETLRFGADDTFEHSRYSVQVASDGEIGDAYESAAEGEIVRNESALVLLIPCDDTPAQIGICVPPDTAHVSGDRLLVRSFFPTRTEKLFVPR